MDFINFWSTHKAPSYPTVLPEFIPFSNFEANDKDIKNSNPPAPIIYGSSADERRSHENGIRSPRDSYQRSPRTSKDRQSSPSHSRRSRNRSRSPYSSRSRNDQKYHEEEMYHRNSERRSNDRNNHHGMSVFDRMSSPPKPRRHGESSRRSCDSNSNDQLPQFVRTVNSIHPAHLRNYDHVESIHQGRQEVALSRTLEIDTHVVQRRPEYDLYDRRIIVERGFTDESAELRLIQERLIAAETHCVGLQSTVRSYEREILKLHQIVSELKNAVSELQRFRWSTDNWSVPFIRDCYDQRNWLYWI